MTTTGTIPAAEALSLAGLITPTEHGIASRVLAKTGGGSVTLFAFASGQGLSEHTSPFEALALVLDGTIAITIGEQALSAGAGTIVRLPATVAARARCQLGRADAAGDAQGTQTLTTGFAASADLM